MAAPVVGGQYALRANRSLSQFAAVCGLAHRRRDPKRTRWKANEDSDAIRRPKGRRVHDPRRGHGTARWSRPLGGGDRRAELHRQGQCLCVQRHGNFWRTSVADFRSGFATGLCVGQRCNRCRTLSSGAADGSSGSLDVASSGLPGTNDEPGRFVGVASGVTAPLCFHERSPRKFRISFGG